MFCLVVYFGRLKRMRAPKIYFYAFAYYYLLLLLVATYCYSIAVFFYHYLYGEVCCPRQQMTPL